MYSAAITDKGEWLRLFPVPSIDVSTLTSNSLNTNGLRLT